MALRIGDIIMAAKARILAKLENLEKIMLQALRLGRKKALTDVCRELEAMKSLSRQVLPEAVYVPYGEIYDGLLLAIRQMTEKHAERPQEDVILLCQELLQHIIIEMQREMTFKKEIVFLPYQASMWDSLESVWKAAYEDKEHCNAYVIPIPYCDRNPDGSAKEWHCERDEFPRYVPTLDWRDVDLKAWHPDVIFFHSPYDDCNLVTSVESRYYSRNLKECTDKLVYIPYFVLEEPCSEEGVSHFALTPGAQNADVVILQSEAMRQVYIGVLSRDTKIKDRIFWEKRIFGIGSPKIDKVLTSKREDFEMPEEWRKLVKGRKVILYNTSLGAMLLNSDKVCGKLRYVFDFFRDRDDVVFWWRPHPLMKSTLHSMRPQFEEEYLDLEQQYIEEKWGIYDDSPDLHRAICWSDAYYGDESSVANLYKKTNKPLLYQTMSSYGDSVEISLFDVSLHDNELWFVSRDMNIIGYLNRKTMQLEKAVPIEAWKLEKDGEYARIVYVNDEILVMPYTSAIGIYQYNNMTNIGKFVHLKEHDVANNEGRFSDVHLLDGKVYGIPYAYSSIVEYSPCDNTVSYYDDFAKDLECFLPKCAAYRYYGVDSYRLGESIYIPFRHSNLLIEFDTKRKSFTYHKVGRDENVYEHITYDGANFWISSAKAGGCIIRWNPKTYETKEYAGFPRECDFTYARMNGYSGFTKMICANDVIYLFPGMLNMVIEMDVKTGYMKANTWITQFLASQKLSNWYKWFQFVKIIDGVIYAGMFSGKKLLVIDVNNKTIEAVSVRIDSLQYERCRTRSTKSLVERMMVSDVTSLLENVKNNITNRKKRCMCGNKIYSMVTAM